MAFALFSGELMIKITFFSKPKFYSYCLILLISSCAGAKICPDYSSIYQNDGKEAEGNLTGMKGRSFNGYLVWGTETGKKSYCVAKVIAQDDSMTELRLMSSYHCLRTLTLDNMSLPSEDIKLHLALDVSKNLCQYKGFNVPIKNIASSNYLVNLRHKFEKIAEIKNIPVPLNPSRRVSDYKSLKSTDEPWLEAFPSAPRSDHSDEGPLMKGLCSTVNRDSSSTTDEKYKKILGAEKDRRFFAACYLYADLAHVDLEIERKVWSGFQTSCLRGSTETSKYKLPNISMDMKTPLSAASEWDEVLRRWQLSPRTPEGHSINDFLTVLKRKHNNHKSEYIGKTEYYRFNNGNDDDETDDITASFRNINNKLYIWTAFRKVGQDYYDFVKSPLQPQPLGAPSQVSHILAMINNDWGFTIIYDKASLDITEGASGSLLATGGAKGTTKRGHILGALYSVEGKETAAPPCFECPRTIGRINLPHLPIQEADDDLPLANNQSNESTSPSQTPPPATNGDEGTQPDPAAEETQSETRPQPRSQPHEYIEPKPGRETMQAVEVVVPPTGGAGSSNGTSPTGGTIHEEGGWTDASTGNQYNKNGELVCVASKP